MIIVESVTVVFSLISLFLTVAACIFPYWKEGISNDMLKTLSPNYNQGLWTKCKHPAQTTKWECSSLSDIFWNLPTEIQAMRILIFLSISCQVLGIVTSVFGFNCTSIGNHRPDLKYRLNVSSLVFHILGIITIAMGTLWITIQMLRTYYDTNTNSQYGSMYLSSGILSGSPVGIPSWCVYLILAEVVFSLLTIVLMCLITSESAKPNIQYLSQHQHQHRQQQQQHLGGANHYNPNCEMMRLSNAVQHDVQHYRPTDPVLHPLPNANNYKPSKQQYI